MILIQRVRVRWSAAARGAPAANARRGLNQPVALPRDLPEGDVVIHDVLVDEADDYTPRHEVLTGSPGRAHAVGLWLSRREVTLGVDRLPTWAAYPHPRASSHLFALAPGQVGRYRANFRFTGCSCSPSWYFEDWVVHVSHGLVDRDRFEQGRPDRDLDDRVHLYGGTGRPARRPCAPALTGAGAGAARP
ncbi:hypothetical protein [Micromonospora maritima]|uniref:hypothetical protein n=1 Tax=Micromonospora maritima TaxID=986711 RepID=UPI001FE6B93C|nr:hypothetical protein [Micromonospora maritima]